jgi:hypothetical protein
VDFFAKKELFTKGFSCVWTRFMGVIEVDRSGSFHTYKRFGKSLA